MTRRYTGLTFTDDVKAVQQHYGAGDQAARMEAMAVEDPDYRARIERVVVFHVEAFDWNCPQHITPRFTEAEIAEREDAHGRTS